MISYYTILGISENATAAEIKAAFKRLALQYHPDKHAGDSAMEERFKEINQAHQVLSNPYEKARYDLTLKFGQIHTVYETYQPPQPTPPTYSRPRAGGRRRNYSEPPINWRENWIATGYAFAFTLILATVVMTVLGVAAYLREKEMSERLAVRRATFERARTDFHQGRIQPAMATIDSLGAFMIAETDMAQFKASLLEQFLFQAEHHYLTHSYEEAIYYYELMNQYAPVQPLAMKEHLAKSYIHTGQTEKAMTLLNELLLANYRKMEIYLQMALVERHLRNDVVAARRYYEIAGDLAEEGFKSVFGNAYVLMLSARHMTKDHYMIYTGLAESLVVTGEPERGLKAADWNIRAWPDSAQNYVTAAQALEVMSRPQEACQHYRAAQRRGAQVALPSLCGR